jgi:VIT1/CCC1 family predicted Fe2+/Mn2+ transporter
MDKIKPTGKKIELLNKRFSLLLENFVEKYILYLKYPNNEAYTNETNFVISQIDDINSKSFLLMNDMESEIEKESKNTASLTTKMETLKKENNIMREKLNGLKSRSITAEGMFDDQLSWYREQLTTIIVLVIGVIVGMYFFIGLKLGFKDLLISIAVVIIFGTIFSKLIGFLLDKFKSFGNKMDDIQ